MDKLSLLRTETESINEKLQSYSKCEAYIQHVIRYGIEGFVHAYIMSQAKEVVSKKATSEEFVSRYKLTFGRNRLTYFELPISKLQEEGIFIPDAPKLAPNFQSGNRKVFLFNGDYKNNLNYSGWKDKKQALTLIDRVWSHTDFANPNLVKMGLQFGRSLWSTSITEFHRIKNGFKDDLEEYLPQSEELNTLADKLIEYYSELLRNIK